jgi:alpha-beta hydrolase superfamily lysophospholipase
MVHWLGEHMGRYSQTAQVLQHEGWICVGYDHLGHGRSEGERGKIPFSDALVEGLVHVAQHVIAEMPSKIAQELPLILLGHSMGGLVVVQAIAKARDRMPDICAAVLSAPALGIFVSESEKWLLRSIPRLLPNLCLDNKINTSSICRDKIRLFTAKYRFALQHGCFMPRNRSTNVRGHGLCRCYSYWRVRTCLSITRAPNDSQSNCLPIWW